jgi:D-alanyl-D-alanine carboxypeptidase (penicillin-binding protein 5/6)
MPPVFALLLRALALVSVFAWHGFVTPAAAQQQGFQTSAPYAILIDSDTGAVLFEKAADELMVPASMAKLMTIELLFNEISKGKVSLDDEFVISESAWRRGGGPSSGSSMFAILNSKVKVVDLIQGITVMSGNDAAIAVAEALAGSEGAFAARMTARARELGMPKSTFTNATGMPDPDQKVTARELGQLANHIIRTYPELYKYFSGKDFTWNKIKQQNRNPLLFMDIGADGLKTGNVGESGFGVVGSAVQNGQRLVVVVNGAKTAKERAEEARRILNWGFRSFEVKEVFPAGAVIGEAKVFGGAPGSVNLVAKGPVRILVPRGSSDRLVGKIVYQGPLRPPVTAGAQVGRLKIQRGDVQVLDTPLYADEDAAPAELTKRAFDAASELVIGFVRSRFSKSGT